MNYNHNPCKTRGTPNNMHNLQHGGVGTRIYTIHQCMKGRVKDKDRKYYYGKGITVCDEWLGKDGFVNFRKWALENGYSDDLTIDRIDYNGNYEPSNCRFVNIKAQANNRNSNHLVVAFGETKNITQWSEVYGINRRTITDRLIAGWDAESAISKPTRSERRTKCQTKKVQQELRKTHKDTDIVM